MCGKLVCERERCKGVCVCVCVRVWAGYFKDDIHRDDAPPTLPLPSYLALRMTASTEATPAPSECPHTTSRREPESHDPWLPPSSCCGGPAAKAGRWRTSKDAHGQRWVRVHVCGVCVCGGGGHGRHRE